MSIVSLCTLSCTSVLTTCICSSYSLFIATTSQTQLWIYYAWFLLYVYCLFSLCTCCAAYHSFVLTVHLLCSVSFFILTVHLPNLALSLFKHQLCRLMTYDFIARVHFAELHCWFLKILTISQFLQVLTDCSQY